MNISEHVRALSQKVVPDRPGLSVRFPNGIGKATTVRTLRTLPTLTAPAWRSATVAGICRGLAKPYIKVISLYVAFGWQTPHS
jgi:hypothetical protein